MKMNKCASCLHRKEHFQPPHCGICGTRIGNAHVVLRAQREQMAIDEAKSSLVEQNRLSRQSKLLANAQQALAKHQLGQNPLTDKDWGNIVRWVLPEAKVPGLMRELKKRMQLSPNLQH